MAALPIMAAVTGVQNANRNNMRLAAERSPHLFPAQPDPEAMLVEGLQRIQHAEQTRLRPGELAQMVNGETALKSALDLGDEMAVRTMVQLDALCLTAPCCKLGPALAYLRETRHEHAARLIPVVEGLLLEHGFVPFNDGSAVPVDALLKTLEERDEEQLAEQVRSGTLTFQEFKTLKVLLTLPPGFEKQDPSLAFLIRCAQARTNGGIGDEADEQQQWRWCTVS